MWAKTARLTKFLQIFCTNKLDYTEYNLYSAGTRYPMYLNKLEMKGQWSFQNKSKNKKHFL